MYIVAQDWHMLSISKIWFGRYYAKIMLQTFDVALIWHDTAPADFVICTLPGIGNSRLEIRTHFWALLVMSARMQTTLLETCKN